MNSLGDFFSRLNNITGRDRRFKEDAYLFVMGALERTLKNFEKPRHISGIELLISIREEAKEQFGPMALTVFDYWGIKNSLDFGEIVFNMVHEGLLSKTEDDRLDDFKDEVFFKRLFDQVSEYRISKETSVLKNT